MTETIKASTSADFLAMVPALAGYTARNSVVVVAFEGKRTCGVFRVDLPDRDRTADHRACISAALGILTRLRRATRVIPVIYTEQSFEGSQGIPHLEFGRALSKRIHDSGYAVPDIFCVAVDGWASYLDPDYPREGHSLSEIEASPVGSIARAAIGRQIGDVSEDGMLPDPDPILADRLNQLLYTLEEDDNGRHAQRLLVQLSGLSDLHPLRRAELCALREYDELPPEAWAWLIHLAQTPSNRDLLMVQFAFGEAIAEVVAEENARYHEIQRATGQTMDEVVVAEIEAGRSKLRSETADLLIGESARRPDVARTTAAIDLLSVLVANVHEDYRVAPLCMLAWLSWSLGRGSAAGTFVNMALELEPDYGMAQLLHTLFAGGRIPEWAFTPA